MIDPLKKMMVGLIGATFMIGAMAPVSAAPVMPTSQIAGSDNVHQVRDDRYRRHGDRRWNGHRPGWNGHRPGPRPGWNGNHRPRPGYWNGHRGYNSYRHGYRRHNDGWWYPLAAFGAGAIVGGAIASQPAPQPVYRYSNNHVQWCYNRYRSYRASDNTFQPYNGPRQQCYSPY